MNNRGQTILHASLRDDDCLKMVEFLLAHADKIGLDVNQKDSNGQTALDVSRQEEDMAWNFKSYLGRDPYYKWCDISSLLSKYDLNSEN